MHRTEVTALGVGKTKQFGILRILCFHAMEIHNQAPNFKAAETSMEPLFAVTSGPGYDSWPRRQRISRDRIEETEGANLYLALSSNPINAIDPDGRFAMIVYPIIIIGGVLLAGCSARDCSHICANWEDLWRIHIQLAELELAIRREASQCPRGDYQCVDDAIRRHAAEKNRLATQDADLLGRVDTDSKCVGTDPTGVALRPLPGKCPEWDKLDELWRGVVAQEGILLYPDWYNSQSPF